VGKRESEDKASYQWAGEGAAGKGGKERRRSVFSSRNGGEHRLTLDGERVQRGKGAAPVRK